MMIQNQGIIDNRDNPFCRMRFTGVVCRNGNDISFILVFKGNEFYVRKTLQGIPVVFYASDSLDYELLVNRIITDDILDQMKLIPFRSSNQMMLEGSTDENRVLGSLLTCIEVSLKSF